MSNNETKYNFFIVVPFNSFMTSHVCLSAEKTTQDVADDRPDSVSSKRSRSPHVDSDSEGQLRKKARLVDSDTDKPTAEGTEEGWNILTMSEFLFLHLHVCQTYSDFNIYYIKMIVLATLTSCRVLSSKTSYRLIEFLISLNYFELCSDTAYGNTRL